MRSLLLTVLLASTSFCLAAPVPVAKMNGVREHEVPGLYEWDSRGEVCQFVLSSNGAYNCSWRGMAERGIWEATEMVEGLRVVVEVRESAGVKWTHQFSFYLDRQGGCYQCRATEEGLIIRRQRGRGR